MLRSFLVCLILMSLAGAGQAADQIRIRLSGALASGSALERTAREFVQNANRRLGGVAHVELIVNGSFETLKNLTSGNTELALLPSSLALDSSKNQDLAVFDLPFFFNDLQEVQALQDSALGVELLTSLTTNDVWLSGFGMAE